MPQIEASPKVQEFCKRFYTALEAGYWGDIDPRIFSHIADNADYEDLDDETLGSTESMVEMLEQVLP